MDQLDKLVVFTNSKKLALIDIEMNIMTKKLHKEDSSIRTGGLLSYTNAQNCLALVTDDSKLLVLDPRVPNVVQRSDLNKIRGIASGITNLHNTR